MKLEKIIKIVQQIQYDNTEEDAIYLKIKNNITEYFDSYDSFIAYFKKYNSLNKTHYTSYTYDNNFFHLILHKRYKRNGYGIERKPQTRNTFYLDDNAILIRDLIPILNQKLRDGNLLLTVSRNDIIYYFTNQQWHKKFNYLLDDINLTKIMFSEEKIKPKKKIIKYRGFIKKAYLFNVYNRNTNQLLEQQITAKDIIRIYKISGTNLQYVYRKGQWPNTKKWDNLRHLDFRKID